MPLRQQIEAKLGGRYGLLLISLVVVLVAYPLCVNFAIGRLLLHLFVVFIMAALAVALNRERDNRVKGYGLGAITLALAIISFAAHVVGFDASICFKLLVPFGALFFGYMAWMIVCTLFKQREINVDLLCGSVVAYLLIGVAWAISYFYIELLAPNSFSFGAELSLVDRASSLFYFSFVTLTTLGYGDILPLSQLARTTAYLEAITGVMYGAILVALLVGNFKKKES
jgi:hypothetical protein